MTAAPLSQVNACIAELEGELRKLRDERLPAALRSAALAYVNGARRTYDVAGADEVAGLQMQIGRLKDLLVGLELVAREGAVAELSAEIERREQAFKRAAERLQPLRSADYDQFASAHAKILDDWAKLEALMIRRFKLTGEPPCMPLKPAISM
jgi:hypothetical protein